MGRSMAVENMIKAALFFCAFSSVGIVFFMVGYMVWIGYPYILRMLAQGVGGLLPFMFNTIYIGTGGTLLGAILGIPCAIYLAEFADSRLRNMVKPTLEVLNGFPSVVLGILGFTIVCFTISRYFPGSTTGLCILAAWIVLAVMSLPLIASVSEDSLRAVPHDLREASLGLGATKWQTTLRVLLPGASSGILTAIILALGNAVGETMAVFAVTGQLTPPQINFNPLAEANVITSAIASGYGDIQWGSPGFNVLFADAFVLFIICAMLNLSTRAILNRRKKQPAYNARQQTPVAEVGNT